MKQQFTELAAAIEAMRTRAKLITNSPEFPNQYKQLAGMMDYHLLAAMKDAKEFAAKMPDTMAAG